MGWLKGITVTLYETEQEGTDPFGAPVYTTEAVEVPNVLVQPTTSLSNTEMSAVTELLGKEVSYRLCIPKGDTHDWTNKRVDFFGKSWLSVGGEREFIESMLPLDWNKQIWVKNFIPET